MDLTRHLGVLILAGGAVLCSSGADRPVFQVRPVADSPSADANRMSYSTPDGQTLTLYVLKKPLLDDSDVASAEAGKDASGAPQVEVKLTPEGRRRFEQATARSVHHKIAVVIDDRVYEAPVIQSAISSDTLIIRDLKTERLATEVASRISSAIKK